MKPYLISLAVGLLVGVVYSLLNVRSPAPPVIAILGLLGMLVGEQVIPVGKQLLAGTSFSTACSKEHAVNHVFGRLPGRHAAQQASEEDRRA